MRTTAIWLLVLLVAAPRAGAQAQDAERWRMFAQRLDTGEFVSVRLQNGTHLRGYFLDVTADAIRIRPKTRIPVAARDIALADIEFMQRKNEGRSPGAKVLMGVGIAGAIILTSLLILVASIDD